MNEDESMKVWIIKFYFIPLEEKARFDIHPSVKVQQIKQLDLLNNEIIALLEEKKEFLISKIPTTTINR